MATYRKLGRETSHRNLMLRNLVTDLLRNGRIETTVTRAKETRRMAEKMITLGKRGDLHARRQVLAYVMDETVVNICPGFSAILIKSQSLGAGDTGFSQP